ncbi:MAG TPA: MBL fold metallo-hydrolase [Candidatus Saccharimonadales bacterium]|nr:MBL fold metallo-hydrolase [Candidatus Saccharimonadales bacterium]
MQLTQENDTLFRLTRFGMINCFLVREDDGFTLIDTGLKRSAKQILKIAGQLGNPIRRIVLTHGHIDHAGSIDELSMSLANAEIAVGEREARILRGDFSLNQGESGKRLWGFVGVKTLRYQEMKHGDRIGSLSVIDTPGHTPGHVSFLDVRQGSLIAGDAFTTQRGLVAAGVFKWHFPFPAIFSWNRSMAAESARNLRMLNPTLLAVGHGESLRSPCAAMDRAIELAYRQCGRMLK